MEDAIVFVVNQVIVPWVLPVVSALAVSLTYNWFHSRKMDRKYGLKKHHDS